MPGCPACATENPDIARFCLACGTSLAPPQPVCGSCGSENPSAARFCVSCGTPLDQAPGQVAQPDVAPHEVRKVVSIVFSDLKGSTSLGERLDSEALREVMSRYFDTMSAALTRHGGTVEKFIGDAIMAVFGFPQLHEDDALRAVRAAHDMQLALEGLNDELERFYGVRLVNRTGVNTGEVVAAEGITDQRLVTGDVVNVAARLEQAAGACEVLIGELTYRLVRDAVEVEPVEALELKGKAERVPAYRLLGLRADRPSARRSRVIGREGELAALGGALDEAIATRSCKVALVLGEAGLGKSTLTTAFLELLGDRAQAVAGRCLPYGDGITFWPLADAVRSAAGIEDDDGLDVASAKLGQLAGDDDVADRIAAAVGLRPAPYAVDEIFWAARKLVERHARVKPLVVLFEDVHWAEPTFLDLITHLEDEVSDAPILVLCAARPVVVDEHEGWACRPSHLRIDLDPLTADECELQVRDLLGATDLDPAAVTKIVEAADGNPLFVEQLLSMLIDEGVLRRDGHAWALEGSLEQLRVPPTIQALLASRLDALPTTERAVIQPASVVGYHFARGAVEHLVGPQLEPHVGAQLASLTDRQLVRPQQAGGDDYRFQHVLVRDTTYDSILKRTRASLHERFVEWADRVNADRVTEFEEILGYHLEQAWSYLSELGPLDARGLALGADAARRLAAAGQRAFERGDAPAAATLLGRAAALLPADDPARLELLPDLGEALLQQGSFREALDILDGGLDAARRLGDERVGAKLTLVRLLVELRTGSGDRWRERVLTEAERAIGLFEPVADHAGLARAWRLLAWSHGVACQWGDAANASVRGLEHARLAGDVRQERRSATTYGVAAVFGPSPVPEALERCHRLLDAVRGDKQTEGWLLIRLASLTAMRGEIDEARALGVRAVRLLEELGMDTEVVFFKAELWRIEMAAGDLRAAERLLRDGYDHLVAVGEKYLLSTVAGLLAQTLFELGNLDEIPHLADLAEELAAEDDIDSQALWRCVRGKLLSRQGEHEDAAAHVRAALDVLAATDAVLFQVGALIDLAHVVGAAGDEEGRRQALSDALELAEAKGDLVTASYVREICSELAV